MTNFIQQTLKRFVVYLVVTAQITIPTVQACELHFELETPSQDNDYNNLSLWIWEKDNKTGDAPVKTQLKCDLFNNTLQDIARHDQNKLSPTNTNGKISLSYVSGSTIIEFTLEQPGGILITKLNAPQNTLHFSTYSHIHTLCSNSDASSPDNMFNAYGLYLNTVSIYNDATILTTKPIHLSSSSFNNKGALHSGEAVHLNIKGEVTNRGSITAPHIIGTMSTLANYKKFGATQNLDITTDNLTNHQDAELGSEKNATLEVKQSFRNYGDITSGKGIIKLTCSLYENLGKILGKAGIDISNASTYFDTGKGCLISEEGAINLSAHMLFMHHNDVAESMWAALGITINAKGASHFLGNMSCLGWLTIISNYKFVLDGNLNIAGPVVITSLLSNSPSRIAGTIQGGSTIDITAPEIEVKLNALISGEQKVSLTATNTDPTKISMKLLGVVQSLQSGIQLQSQEIHNLGDLLAKTIIDVHATTFEHLLKNLSAQIFNFTGDNLSLLGKTNFERELNATVHKTLTYSTPTSTGNMEPSTLSAGDSVNLKLGTGIVNTPIITPAHLYISLLPQAAGLYILQNILTEKGVSFNADVRNLLFMGGNSTELKKIQTFGPMALNGNKVNISQFGLAARGRTTVNGSESFSLGKISHFKDGPWLFYQGDGSYLATADFLEMNIPFLQNNGSPITSKLGASIFCPTAVQNIGGKMEFGGDCLTKTPRLENEVKGITLCEYIAQGGVEANYLVYCLQKTQKPVLHVGGNLTFEDLISGTNYGGDIYAGGVISSGVTKIINSDFQGAPMEEPCLILTQPLIDSLRSLLSWNIRMPSVEEIKLFAEKSDQKTINKIKKNRKINGVPKQGNDDNKYLCYLPGNTHVGNLEYHGIFNPTPSEFKIFRNVCENYQSNLSKSDTIKLLSGKPKHRAYLEKFIGIQRPTVQQILEQRALRAAMFIRHTLSAGTILNLQQYDWIPQIVGAVQAPQINANFTLMVVGVALPLGSVQYASFAFVQDLLDFMRPNLMHEVTPDDPIALINPPKVLREKAEEENLPAPIVIKDQVPQENTDNYKRLYHPTFEIEALMGAIKGNLRRGYLTEYLKDGAEIYRFLLENTRDMWDTMYKKNTPMIDNQKSQDGLMNEMANLAISNATPIPFKTVFATFDMPALIYMPIPHENGNTYLVGHLLWPQCWKRMTEKLRDLHGGLYTQQGNYKGQQLDVIGKIESSERGVYDVTEINLLGGLEYTPGATNLLAIINQDLPGQNANNALVTQFYDTEDQTNTDSVENSHKGEFGKGNYAPNNCGEISGGIHKFRNFKSINISAGASLRPGHTLFDGVENGGIINNKGIMDLHGIACLANAKIVNELVQREFTQKVAIKKKTRKHCGLSESESTTIKNFNLKESLPAIMSGFIKTEGARSGRMCDKQIPKRIANHIPLNIEDGKNVLIGTLMLQELINENQNSIFIPFIETEDDVYALYITDEYIGEDEDEKERRRKYNRNVMSKLLNTTKVPCTSDLDGESVSFKVLDEVATFGDKEYPTATLIRTCLQEQTADTVTNNDAGQNSNQNSAKKSVTFKNYVKLFCFDDKNSPSALPQRKTAPLRMTPPKHRLQERDASRDAILNNIFSDFVIDKDARCKGIINIGGTIIAGKEGIDIRTREAILSIPVVDIALKKYYSSKNSAFSSKKVSGSVETHTTVIPGIISDAHTTLISDEKMKLEATLVLARKKILLESKEDLDLAAKVIVQKIPPKVSKNKGLVTLTQGTMEMGFVTKIASSEDNFTIRSTTGRVIGKAPVLSGCGSNVVEGAKGTKIDALVLNNKNNSKSSGMQGALNHVETNTTTTHQTAMQTVLAPKDKVRKINKENGEIEEVIEEGEIIFKTLDGPILLVAPEMHGNVILNPINGDGKIDSAILKSSEKTKKKTYSVNFWGKGALEKAMNGEKPNSILNSLVRESSLFSAAGDLCVSKDAQGALASGLKAAYETYQTLEAINGAKSLTEFGLSQIASVGVSFGTSSSKEKQTTAVKPKAMANRDVKIIVDDNHNATFVGLEGEVRNLEGKGENVTIKSPIQTFKKDTKDNTYAVNYNIATNSVSVSASMAKGKQRGTQHAHGNLKVTGTTTLKALDLVTVAAPVDTKHLHLEAKRLLVESKQDKFKSSQKSAGGSAGMGGGSASFSSSKVNIKEVKQQSGFNVSDTSFVDVTEKSIFKGGAINVGTGAVAFSCRDAQGNSEQCLFEIKQKADGDCALHCLGLSREQAIEQLMENVLTDETVRELIRQDINTLNNEAESKEWTIPTVTGTTEFKNLFQQHKAAKSTNDESEQRRIEALQQAYFLRPEVCCAFIKQIYDVKENRDDEKWFSPPMLSALARINGFHLIIKTLSANGTLDTNHEYKGGELERILLHTKAGEKGGFYLPNRDLFVLELNHYNLLSKTPGVIRSPEIEHHDLKGHSKSKSTNFGANVNFSIAPTRDSKGDINGFDAKMADGILGTASFGYQTKDVRTKVQTTITKTNAIESNTDMSSCNDDMKNAKVVTSKKGSKIQAFVPLVNPMDLPKLVDRAVDNFNGVVNKPLVTPEDKPVVTQQHKKEEAQEEPKDTSITDEEVNAIFEDLIADGALLAAKGKKAERKEASKDCVDHQAWASSMKQEILKQNKNFTPEEAGFIAEKIISIYENHRKGGKDQEQALNATQAEVAHSLEKSQKKAEYKKVLYTNAYDEGLRPVVAQAAVVPIYLAGVAIATLICQTFYTTKDIADHNQKNANANVPQQYRMDATPQGQGSGWTDSGVDTEPAQAQINSTPVADPTPTREGFDAAPQEYTRGVNEGFGVADDVPDMSILTVLGYTKVYVGYTKPDSDGGVPYVGRTSGYGDVNDLESLRKIVADRDRNHHMDEKGFGRARVQVASESPVPIRGWEQIKIEDYGGAQSKGGSSSNKINGISETNPKKDDYLSEAKRELGL